MNDLAACASLNQQAFQLKGSLFTLSVLQLQNTANGPFTAQLNDLVRQAPKFFSATPIVLDLQALPTEEDINFDTMINVLRERSMIPAGIRGGTSKQQAAAKKAGLAIFTASKAPTEESDSALTSGKKKPTAKPKPANKQFTKIIDKPVRSGQQIYAREASLVVLSSVSQGAELLADGSIHIYGALRGRALAGISGDTNARIFCGCLDAELVSIAGRYIANDSLQKYANKEAMQVMLNNEKIHIEALK